MKFSASELDKKVKKSYNNNVVKMTTKFISFSPKKQCIKKDVKLKNLIFHTGNHPNALKRSNFQKIVASFILQFKMYINVYKCIHMHTYMYIHVRNLEKIKKAADQVDHPQKIP